VSRTKREGERLADLGLVCIHCFCSDSLIETPQGKVCSFCVESESVAMAWPLLGMLHD
jgi:hypothetical protein